MADKPKAVEIAPNWEQSATLVCIILRDGTPEGKDHAQAEIVRMGQLLDQMGAERPS
ncbi:MAG: hypothetical protein ABGX10_16760 [Paracoccus sp. (in: a-proteobacteria)]|uniref:hypothetical protein n=1 Tax=Paracoccus sp. TaxID=267 RepID=UPI00324244C0